MGWPEPEDFRDAEPFIRRRWDAGLEQHRQSWAQVREAYRFGWEWARSRTLTGATWKDVEPGLRRRWNIAKQGSGEPWDTVRPVVFRAFHESRDDTWWHDYTRRTW